MIKIRPLKVDDVFPMVSILANVIQSTTVGDEKTVGKTLLTGIMGAKDDIKGWLADLCGLAVDEFNEQPPSFLLDVLDQLITDKDFKDFFGRALKYATLRPKGKLRESGKTSTQSPPAMDGQTDTSAPSNTPDTGK